MKRLLPLVLMLGSVACLAPGVFGAAVKLIPRTDRVRVEIDGQLFTEYVFGDGASRPYCYPILAADGTSLTRDFPMKVTPGEEQDHPWHRSMWFAHSAVNGVDFWNEGVGGAAGGLPAVKGRSEHEAFIEVAGGATGVLRTRNRWVAPDGKLICTDERTLRFSATAAGRFIDFEITLHAPADTSVLMGDNKDGTMALRLAQWMTAPHIIKSKDAAGKTAETPFPGVGHIVNAAGDKDAAAWGKRADWCDYYAPHDGKTYGVAIFDHPQNLRHPTWWMARDYGLFGANPFGQHDYEGLKDQPHIGDHTIPAGGSLTLRYRFYFHLGDETAAQVALHYAEYAAGK
jgi:hypothetical protein